MIALGTRRPMRIHDDEFDVGMLNLEDFDLEPFEETGPGAPIIPPAKENRSTALMCVQLARLCLCIGHVVSSQYTTTRTQADQQIPPTVMVVSRRDEGRAEELERCDRDINEWWQSLSANVQRTGSPAKYSDLHSCSEVHWAVLNITFQTVVNVLHRSHALKPLSDASEAENVQRTSRSKVKESARSLTKLSQTLMSNDQLRYLGLIGVTAIIAAYLSHLLDISSVDEDLRDASTFRLYQSLQVLNEYRKIYASADAAVSFLASVSRKAGVSVPTEVVEPGNEPASALVKNTAAPITNGAHVPVWKENDFAVSPMNGVNGYQPDKYLANTPYQAPRGGHEQVLTTNSMLQPSLTPMVSGASPGGGLGDTTFGVLPNSNAVGSFFDWNTGLDTSLDLETMTFNYDFFSDAFGFSDGQLQGM